ncbi:MAG: histidinol phosphate phosphatase domain-containing protein [Spirochaetia bacterium]|nr:histidinol phosphate phosphatase domain-containing protein [Spirochaetia bacterium]
MIDLHTHSFHSDGVLLPSELIQRARKTGYEAIAITDHADISNIAWLTAALKRVCTDTNKAYRDIICLPGVEITHTAPVLIKGLVVKARKLGAKIVVMHGESPVEPVEPGTNRAAIEAGVDILAHPGYITEEDVRLAKKNNVCLEITARAGHNITNNHVARLAKKAGAKMVFDTDSHSHTDLRDDAARGKILKAAGLNDADIMLVIENSKKLVRRYFKT